MVLYHLFLKIYRLVGTLQLGCPCIDHWISPLIWVSINVLLGPTSTFSNSKKQNKLTNRALVGVEVIRKAPHVSWK